MPSKSDLLRSQPLPAPHSFSSWLSTLDGAGEKWASLATSALLGKAVPTHMLSLFPAEEITVRKSLLALSCATLGKGWHEWNQTVPLILSSVFKLVQVLLRQHAGTSPLDFWTSPKAPSSVGDYLKTVFSRGSRTAAERGWRQLIGHCRVHRQDTDLSAYYLMHGWVKFLPGPLACGAGSHNSHKGTYVHVGMPNCCWDGYTNEGHLIRPSCWCANSLLIPRYCCTKVAVEI